MTGKKNAAPVLEHQDGKMRREKKEKTTGTYIVYQAAAACKTYLLRCGAVLAALASLWWLCAICAGTAGGVTGPIGMAIICGWLARELAQAAERGYIDGKTDAEV